MVDSPRGTPAEPVAVVGIGCRLPGDVRSPEEFWDLLRAGRNTAGPLPAERWLRYEERGPEYAAALRDAVRHGSFLDDIEGFDAEFFGLSPREAELMDPQQRILMETAWEALEHAGLPPHELAGTDAGVFVGVCTADYGARLLEDLPQIEAWTGIGAATCAVANRVSYSLDLRGPSMAIDTACSASLVALHLAAQSLRLGESDVALAGGVNLLVTPGQTLTLGSAGALAPDGRSKSFDASADGYGRGEGCGVVVLKRLSDARRAGDRILALVIGSAVNQDGHTDGIMAPCGQAQEHVMTRACRQAGVAPSTVDYVEAHGTGTRLGDPLEAGALSSVYGTPRPPGDPCLIGSVKSNIGHLEGAAGIAGVIKAVLALDRGEIPPTVLTTLNPDIPWESSGLRVVTGRTAWPERDHPRRAGVSSFGYGGTVAHILLEQAPPAPATPREERRREERLFPLSAASERALRQYAGALADHLDQELDQELDQRADQGLGQEFDLASAGHTLALRRTALARRAVVLAADRDELTAGLRRLAADVPAESVLTGDVLPEPGPGPVWVFSGQGCQWRGMGRELLAVPEFASLVDEVEPIFAEEIGFSPRQVLAEGELDGIDRVQTMIFVMQLGLARLWNAYGVTPKAVIGHSVGEIAAAVTAGAMTVADGARLICRRSRLLRRAEGKGAMVMVGLSFEEAAERLAGRTDLVAAIASAPGSTVLSGDVAAVEDVVNEWPAEGIVTRRVASDVAFHSPQMEPLAVELAASVADLSFGAPTIPMYTTALADPRSTPVLDGAYWAANLRDPVRLAAAATAAAQDGHRVFLEISPHPVVAHSVTETLAEHGYEDVFVGTSLRRNQPETSAFLVALGTAHCHGVDVDWRRLQPDGGLADLPPYAWQHRRHWRESYAEDGNRGHDVNSHTLLGAVGALAGSRTRVWRTSLEDANRPYPGSHALNGVEIVPAAVLVNTFLRAAGDEDVTLTGVEMTHPLMTAERRQIQVVHEPPEVRLAARTPAGPGEPEPAWLVHVAAAVAAPGQVKPDTLPDAGALAPIDPGFVHRRLAAVGVPSTGFEWTIGTLLGGPGVLRATVSTGDPGSWAPALDAAMSVAPCVFPGDPVLRMVVRIDELVLTGAPPSTVIVDAAVEPAAADTVRVLLADVDGRVVGHLAGLRYPVIDAPAPAEEELRGPAESYAGLTPEDLRERVLAEIRAEIAAVMRLDPEDLAPRRPLVEQGLDSVMTVMVRRRLEKRFGRRLPATLLWQRPTIAAIADHLGRLLATPDAPAVSR
ncbi:beta-ketoacyl synthase N-terminal-like domain-containing protein [Nonomuraea sp. MCN248]|uniref:Beta-ketoacyl synthase N-terminal-like domain-containing protein n=1 Tax=Nonomuraea corallina TaxID=2989783 RepID=A0ABT4SFT7_9ACTN|nr:beta-ketoacyl synthase N-terminal-like domain-containing protein [Nonomuraea corallina]MDA0636081.1 beta-ketoacyl synthase N-terminal-like domain-containing protein [Nonomuraea corallina]